MALSALLCFATTSAYADGVNIKFEANGNSTIIENVELPHTFKCIQNTVQGDFDLILKGLYGWGGSASQTYCFEYKQMNYIVSTSDSSKVGANGINYGDQEFTINSVFDGEVTVGGWFSVQGAVKEYSVKISIVTPSQSTYTVSLKDGTVDAAKWTAKA